MRYFILVFAIILGVASCDSSKSATKKDGFADGPVVNDTLRIANDSLEYEIIIIEPGFNSWLVTQFPEDYYSLNFLENQNTFFVAEYNRRVLNPSGFNAELYPIQINYEYNVDYGKEVNYLLYNYFIFFQRTYNQKLK